MGLRVVGWHRFACQPGCGFNIASLVEAGAVGGLACGASIVIPHIDGDHYFQGLAFMEQELKKISRWERRRPFYQRPPARSAHNPVNERSDVHPPPLAPYITLGQLPSSQPHRLAGSHKEW